MTLLASDLQFLILCVLVQAFGRLIYGGTGAL
ncbi:MAG: hypothetical protein ACJA1I_000786 [Zhongshania marina]|jgi:hypothetical protein